MSLFRIRARPVQQRDLFGIATGSDLIMPRWPANGGGGGGANSTALRVTTNSAMRHSAVWAAIRLRAGLISTFPADVYRMFGSDQVEAQKPPILIKPGGEAMDYVDWMYATQVDLDRCGNTIGLITEVNGYGLPGRIDLQSMDSCSVLLRPGQPLRYRIENKIYDADKVWHERQYVVPGLPVGLSPVTYAAWSIGYFQSAEQFAAEWYASGGIPKAHLRNTEVTVINPDVATAAKERFRAATDGRDIFVTGKDWEYKPIQSSSVGNEWLDAQKFGVSDVARFFDVPGDLIDAASQARGNITYANVTQRNLQFLIMHLGPAIVRREKNLSKLIPLERFVKLNTDALLRMDPLTRAQAMDQRIQSRTLTPTEARAYENQPPLTQAQIDEFTELFGPPAGSTPPTLPGAAPGVLPPPGDAPSPVGDLPPAGGTE